MLIVDDKLISSVVNHAVVCPLYNTGAASLTLPFQLSKSEDSTVQKIYAKVVN